ncbi:DUF882 domain-containing protein [Ancylobacter sp. VKM B-3255]|uniref:Murein endopeptidase K n=1 Tax=Ancylobacter radicis TaxID=2836179 RepID=A0ABS5RBU2_9HYPH|nr:DUF882 domain-containing protein [Ancylobacter radicis]
MSGPVDPDRVVSRKRFLSGFGYGYVRISSVFRSHRVAKWGAVKVAALAAFVTFGSADMLQNAVANGDTRTLTLHHVHSGASATVTFKRNGRYDPAALKQLNVLLQDWRRKESTNMDPRLFDIIWEVYRESGATQPIQVIGGYRSPATNAMLRQRSRGVAKTSLHMQGKAMDFYIPGVPLAKIREAGLRLERGGVGFYPTSGSPFVHMDTGGIRHWPRMTRPELARVFPDGKTVHVPADGKPMAGYALALAEVESRGSEPGGAGAAFAGLSGGNDPKRPGAGGKNIFAALFGKDDEEEADTAPAAAPARATTVAARAPAATPAAAADDDEAPVVVAAAPAAAPAPAMVPVPVPHPLGRTVVAAAPSPAPQTLAAQTLTAQTIAPPTPPAGAQSLAALAAAVPLPAPRHQAPAEAASVVVASAGPLAPLPPARPNEAGARAGTGGLPEIIVNGTQGGAPALAYASAAGDIFPSERLQPGRAPAAGAAPSLPSAAAKAATPTAQPAAVAHNAQPSRPGTAAHAAEMQAEIRRLFSGPTVARNVVLRTPELRRFAAFVAPPRQVVATGFSKDQPAGPPTAHFTGAAIVAVPVVAMVSGPAPLKKPL